MIVADLLYQVYGHLTVQIHASYRGMVPMSRYIMSLTLSLVFPQSKREPGLLREYELMDDKQYTPCHWTNLIPHNC